LQISIMKQTSKQCIRFNISPKFENLGKDIITAKKHAVWVCSQNNLRILTKIELLKKLKTLQVYFDSKNQRFFIRLLCLRDLNKEHLLALINWLVYLRSNLEAVFLYCSIWEIWTRNISIRPFSQEIFWHTILR